MTPFFSVIVPAHNSQQYLARCLASVTRQTCKDYELIVVCDACTDDTATVAKFYTDTDNIIITNHGIDGLARNTGIDAAKGKWLMFLDDDDWWIHEYVLEEAKSLLESMTIPVDMLLFDFIWKDAPEWKKPYYQQTVDNVNIAVWSKAFRRDFVGDTRFPAVPFTSDKYFMDEIVKKHPTAYVTHQLIYYYNYMREGSQTEEHSRQEVDR